MQRTKYSFLILLILACLPSRTLWAATTSYVLNVATEYSLSTIEDGQPFALSGPGATLTFQAKKSSGLAVSNFYAQASTDGTNWTDLGSPSLGTSYKSFSYNIAANVTHIRFVTKFGATLKKSYKDIKVTRATTLSLADGVSPTLDVGEVKVGKTVSATIRVAYNNTTYDQTLTGSCTNNAFSVTSRSMGETGEADVTINFAPTQPGTQSGTVTLSMAGATTEFTVSGTAADKGTPTFTWNVRNAYTNHSYSDFFSTTNNECPYTITSSDETIGKVEDGKLAFFDKEGTVVFSVQQEGNEDWNAKSETFTVNVTTAQNHLPMTIVESNQATLVRSISGSYAWDDGGIRLGDGGGGFNWDDKTAEIVFEGIPDRLKFDFERTSGTATGVGWNAKVSADGSNWTEIWSSSSGSGSADVEITDAAVRYVRLTYSGNFGGYFKNINITERRYLRISKNSLAFGRNTKGESVATQTFVVSHCNAGFGVTLTSSSEIFAVTPETLTSTGGDRMGEETITVTYLNNLAGEHTATLTVSDPNGSHDDLSLALSGTTQTTYYTRAEALHSSGGQSFASFTSYDAATQSSDATNSGLTTALSATATAFFKAEAEPGYVFLEWRRTDTDEFVSTNTTEKWENYSYDTEDASQPFTASLKAYFAPMFYFEAQVHSSDAAMGSATVNLSESVVQGKPDAATGQSKAVFTATAEDGYEFLGWGTTADATEYESTANPHVVTLTNGTPGSTTQKVLYAIFAQKGLTLSATSTTEYVARSYPSVTVLRTFKQGFSTLSLPFSTTVAELTGRTDAGDWIATLRQTTWNQRDGYTLFFQKVEDGRIEPNTPYVLHLSAPLADPVFAAKDVAAEAETTVSQGDWSMTCNYTPAKTMGGLYGVVNANSNIQRGGTSSTLDGLTAYFTYTGTKSLVKAVVSYLDADGKPLGITSATLHDEACESYFSPTGQQLSAPQHGITIVRKADGSVRKVLCR